MCRLLSSRHHTRSVAKRNSDETVRHRLPQNANHAFAETLPRLRDTSGEISKTYAMRSGRRRRSNQIQHKRRSHSPAEPAPLIPTIPSREAAPYFAGSESILKRTQMCDNATTGAFVRGGHDRPRHKAQRRNNVISWKCVLWGSYYSAHDIFVRKSAVRKN